ncbi:MAG: M20/M25/M40 family metallo-hydrolase [Thermodesulfobacteriota bacterium]
MIDSDRLKDRFDRLVRIDSESLEERAIALELTKTLEQMGATVAFDRAADMTGGNCGNLVAKFKGTVEKEPFFLSGHMDTVKPGKGVIPVFENGLFKSQGETILGADDKSALAIILEVMQVVLENGMDHPPIEIVFTVSEEIGLLGAKYFDYSMIDSTFGYVLDSTDPEGIVTNAPSGVKLDIKVHGRTAHAGGEPEKGINAIAVASKAVSTLEIGRIDHETTCNLGIIKGGNAVNIVPDLVEIAGEVRSHDESKLEKVTRNIKKAFLETADAFSEEKDIPKIDFVVKTDYPKTAIPVDHKVIRLAEKAAENLGVPLKQKTVGGGSDANFFFSKSIVAGVLGTGMKDVHTLNEHIALQDMVSTGSLLLEIIRIQSAGGVS